MSMLFSLITAPAHLKHIVKHDSSAYAPNDLYFCNLSLLTLLPTLTFFLHFGGFT